MRLVFEICDWFFSSVFSVLLSENSDIWETKWTVYICVLSKLTEFKHHFDFAVLFWFSYSQCSSYLHSGQRRSKETGCYGDGIRYFFDERLCLCKCHRSRMNENSELFFSKVPLLI